MLRTSLVVAALAAFAPPLASQTYNWITNPANGHRYALVGPRITRTQAEAAAIAAGGHLATVRDMQELDWIERTFHRSIPNSQFWIGLHQDPNASWAWAWASGEPTGFFRWSPHNPWGAPGESPCVFLTYEFQAYFGMTATGCGHDARWLYGIIEVRQPAAGVASFGTACAGSVGVPTLDAVQGSSPRLGEVFSMHATGLSPNPFAGAFGLLGLSDQQLPGGVALPVDLGVLGMNGCSLYVSADDAVALRTFSGAATWDVTIPFERTLAGINLFFQIAASDPGANPLGVVTSNGLRLTLGY